MSEPCSSREYPDDGVDLDDRDPALDLDVGDIVWDPEMGEAHEIVSRMACGSMFTLPDGSSRKIDCGCGGWLGPCAYPTAVCRCGEDGSWRDHHYVVIYRGDVAEAKA